MITEDDKRAAVDRLLTDLAWARDADEPEARTYDALAAIARDLRADEPREVGRVLAAMKDQVNRALKHKARIGYVPAGNCRTIAEAVIGRWWPTIKRSLEKHETEVAT